MNDETQHPITRFSSYGHLSTSGPDFAQKILENLFNDAEPVLSDTLSVAISINDQRRSGAFDQYKEEIAEQKINHALREPRENLHKIFVNHLEKAKQNKKRIQDRIKSHSQPRKFDDTSQQVDFTLRMRECRDLLRAAKPEDRKAMIEDALDRGDPSFLIAASNSPDQLINQNSLNELQRRHAFSEDPSLQEFEYQVDVIEKVVRKKCAEIDSTQGAIYESEYLEDPLTRQDHYATFEPRDDHEREMANMLISHEQSRERVDQMNQDFDAKNQGMNLG